MRAVNSKTCLATAILVGLSMVLFLFVSPQAGCANAACDGMEGGPSLDGNGVPNCGGFGDWCYVCTYSYSGGYTICSGEGGTDSICVDYQY